MHLALPACAATAVLLCAACSNQELVSPSATDPGTTMNPVSTNAGTNTPSVVDNRAEQIVFSGQIPPGTFSGTQDHDVDFWIWCEHKKANNSYAGQCVGSMGIDALTEAVSGAVHMDGDLDQHFITVSSKDNAIACTLSDADPAGDEGGNDTEVPHTQGPTNDVNVDCSQPSAFSGVFHGAVVLTTESPAVP